MNKRVGDIEYKKTCPSYYKRPSQCVEIVRWVPNVFYGRESEYERTYLGSYRTEWGFIDESCFKHKQTCYTLAFVDIKEEPMIRCCGLRPFELEGKDSEDFDKVVKLAYQYATKIYEKSKNYKQ